MTGDVFIDCVSPVIFFLLFRKHRYDVNNLRKIQFVCAALFKKLYVTTIK